MDHTCHYPLAGMVQSSGPDGISILDFGVGASDDEAIGTVDGVKETISLEEIRKRKHGRLRD